MVKVGIQSEGWYDHSNAIASFEYIKSCGFDSVDYNIDEYLDYALCKKMSIEGICPTLFDRSTEELLEFFKPLKEAAEKTGVRIGQMHAPYPCWFDGKEEVNEYILSALDKCFAICEFVGCPAIVVHPQSTDTKAYGWEVNLAFYRRLIPLIKKYHGVKICTENIFAHQGIRFTDGRLCNANEMSLLVDYLNEEAEGDYFGFCFDVGHAILTRRDIKEYLKEMGDRVTLLHIHDNNGEDDQHIIPYSCLYGTDLHCCDWDGFIEGLREINYQGVLSFETARIFSAFPKGAHTAALKLISAIGHDWAERLEQ